MFSVEVTWKCGHSGKTIMDGTDMANCKNLSQAVDQAIKKEEQNLCPKCRVTDQDPIMKEQKEQKTHRLLSMAAAVLWLYFVIKFILDPLWNSWTARVWYR